MLSILNMIWGNKEGKNRLQIYVKPINDLPIPIDVNRNWQVRHVKDLIGHKLGLSPLKLSVIFAGHVLDDSTQIKECNLGEQSVIHTVEHCNRSNKHVSTNLTVDEETNTDFFVYCSTCRYYKKGKLRVRCSSCHDGAVELHRDPSSWRDVLESERIQGSCKTCSAADNAVVEFYFKCCKHTPSDDSAVPLDLIKPNRLDIPCLVCMEVSNPVLVFPCLSKHAVCIPCFVNYCINRISERNFILDKRTGYTLGCPVGCENSYIEQPYHFKLLPPELYRRYQKFATEEFILQNGGVLCPRRECGEGILLSEGTNRIICPRKDCQFEFCKLCLSEFHSGECERQEAAHSAKSWLLTRWDEWASKNTIRKISKPCPHCHVQTEKDGGCMHVYCRCGFNWCWICCSEWTSNCRSSHWFG
ncbi:E3 ubiquitin-protein ligase parkin-like [Cimex lectularius]|uniref:E3 ubiquitin-protein ligase parkin n=1 Tax=Cimex lectularius TaxID=79782 RepID=A0A8I6TE05_CIMLE|nr:E3 ubiquitin-protein ligase parkin-like [Cimex lectularius]